MSKNPLSEVRRELDRHEKAKLKALEGLETAQTTLAQTIEAGDVAGARGAREAVVKAEGVLTEILADEEVLQAAQGAAIIVAATDAAEAAEARQDEIIAEAKKIADKFRAAIAGQAPTAAQLRALNDEFEKARKTRERAQKLGADVRTGFGDIWTTIGLRQSEPGGRLLDLVERGI